MPELNQHYCCQIVNNSQDFKVLKLKVSFPFSVHNSLSGCKGESSEDNLATLSLGLLLTHWKNNISKTNKHSSKTMMISTRKESVIRARPMLSIMQHPYLIQTEDLEMDKRLQTVEKMEPGYFRLLQNS